MGVEGEVKKVRVRERGREEEGDGRKRIGWIGGWDKTNYGRTTGMT